LRSQVNIIPVILLLSVSLVLISCQNQKTEWKGTIEKVDGVTVIKNPKEPMYAEDAFSLEEELSIGEAEGREEYLLSSTKAVAVDDNEDIYIVDAKENHIRVFDKNGDYLKTIGRTGQGPGEFNQITNIQITPENELMVHDRYTRRLTFFSLEGDYLRTVLLKGIQASVVKVNSIGNYLVKTYDFDSPPLRIAIELKVYSSDLAFIRTIAKDKFWNANVPLQPHMASTFLPSDLIICGSRESYEFKILDSEGKTVQKVSKDYVPIEINEEEKKKRRIAQISELPKFFPAFQDFSVDEEGRIIVQTFERYEDEEKFYFDVFNTEGKYIAKVPLNALPQCWKNRKMYTIEEDKDGYQYIKRYKLIWKY
jgi:hypothetical protein